MNFKVRYFFISLLVISGLFLVLTMLNNKDENLKCNIAAATTSSMEGKQAILLIFDYKWVKTPIRLTKDTLEINFSEGWSIEDFSININGNDVTDKFNNCFKFRGNDLVFNLNSNSNFLAEENFEGKVLLVPDDTSAINNKFYSSANLQYIHKNLFEKIIKADSVGWENKKLLSKN